MSSTLRNLISLADFDTSFSVEAFPDAKQPNMEGLQNEAIANFPQGAAPQSEGRKLNLGYTINLNLPATTDIQVYNAIFKSIKEHLLDE